MYKKFEVEVIYAEWQQREILEDVSTKASEVREPKDSRHIRVNRVRPV